MTDRPLQRIAVPLAEGQFSMHLGQSTAFAIFEVDPAQQKILSQTIHPLPVQRDCGLAAWLRQQAVNSVIVGGLGRGAIASLAAAQIHAFAGMPGEMPQTQVQACLDGQLHRAVAACAGHSHRHDHDHHNSTDAACHCRAKHPSQPAPEKDAV